MLHTLIDLKNFNGFVLRLAGISAVKEIILMGRLIG